jgi:tRNA (Thr-GGU) A37 N-methylase
MGKRLAQRVGAFADRTPKRPPHGWLHVKF